MRGQGQKWKPYLQAVKALKAKKPTSAVSWKTDTGQITDKPARGMNPEAWSVA